MTHDQPQPIASSRRTILRTLGALSAVVGIGAGSTAAQQHSGGENTSTDQSNSTGNTEATQEQPAIPVNPDGSLDIPNGAAIVHYNGSLYLTEDLSGVDQTANYDSDTAASNSGSGSGSDSNSSGNEEWREQYGGTDNESGSTTAGAGSDNETTATDNSSDSQPQGPAEWRDHFGGSDNETSTNESSAAGAGTTNESSNVSG